VLRARALSHSFGGQVVLDRVDLAVGGTDRLGVVGPNGAGKSTLLRMLAGLDRPADGGDVERAPASLTVGYLPQEVDARPGETLFAYLERRTGVADAAADLDRRTEAITGEPATIEAHAEALERFLSLGGDDLSSRAGAVCDEVGLPAGRFDQAMDTLSGGEFARASLAAVLLSRFDVLLLDEPTNNLDFAGLDRLEAFVAAYGGAMVIVSHDRVFLDRTVDRVAELDGHTHTVREFAGNWSDYVAARELSRAQQYEAHRAYVTERDRLRERQRTQDSWSEKGVRKAKTSDEPDKNVRRAKIARSEKQASKARTTERRIERLEAVDKPWEGWRLDLSLASSERSGDVVARLDDAVVERGAFTLGPLDLEINWRDRVAVVGPNGSGKSTLLGALLGTVPLSVGSRWLGPGVVVGEMDQARTAFDGDRSVAAVVQERTGLSRSETRSLLAKFGLGADHVARSGAELSPGERSRAVLAVLMAEGVNCLVLDEPTNHLDIEAIEQLEQALAGYDGTLIVVSHDRRFLESLAITREVAL
jgi:ATPase subunit of ABC transporter with duplicated ATPase domains